MPASRHAQAPFRQADILPVQVEFRPGLAIVQGFQPLGARPWRAVKRETPRHVSMARRLLCFRTV
jgi:hypothetical protein